MDDVTCDSKHQTPQQEPRVFCAAPPETEAAAVALPAAWVTSAAAGLGVAPPAKARRRGRGAYAWTSQDAVLQRSLDTITPEVDAQLEAAATARRQRRIARTARTPRAGR